MQQIVYYKINLKQIEKKKFSVSVRSASIASFI